MSKYCNQLKPLSLTTNQLGSPSTNQCWIAYHFGLQVTCNTCTSQVQLAQGGGWTANLITEANLCHYGLQGNCLKVEPLCLVHAGMYIQGWMGGWMHLCFHTTTHMYMCGTVLVTVLLPQFFS